MASGDTLIIWTASDSKPPGSNYAVRDRRNGHDVLDFNDSEDRAALFEGALPSNYGGGGVTVTLVCAFSTATNTSQVARMEVAIERMDDAGLDIDSDSFAGSKVINVSPRSTSGVLTYASASFSHGSEMDGLQAGEAFRLRVMRDGDGTGGTDDASGDLELLRVVMRET